MSDHYDRGAAMLRGRNLPVVAGLVAAMLAGLLLDAGVVSAHGYTDNPKSRARWCQVGEVRDCGPVQYEPQSTEGPKGFPAAGPADGHLCSAGIDHFGQVDAPYTPAGARWPVTTLTMGDPLPLRWTITASHSTTAFRYFITRTGWDADRPLTRAALNAEPFLTVELDGAKPGKDVLHEGAMVPHVNGHHVILAVWDIADTANAFYSCADVYIM